MATIPKNPMKPLGEVANIFIGIPSKAQEPGAETSATRFLTVRSIENGNVNPALLFPSIPSVSLSEKYKLMPDDVILPARSTFIDVALVPQELNGAYFNATLIAVRCGKALSPQLLRAYLRHPIGQDELDAVCQSGGLQKSVTVKALSTISVPVPPLAEQERLTRLLEIAESAYVNAVQAAQSRYVIASEIAINRMLRKDSK